jgi:phosphotransferase system  glucose/maltose/N-acetylglucosamine-specific IIC component
MSVITLKNDVGVVRKVPIGFSWTMLFFGPLVPLFRGDIKWTILYLLVVLVTLPFYGVGCLILPFIYNKRYVIGLFERGYKPADEESRKILVAKGIITAPETQEEV